MTTLLTVLTPAPTQDLTVLATVKAEIEQGTTADDTVLGNMIRQASGEIGRYCHRVFGQETVRERFTVPWNRPWNRNWAVPLFLARTPVASIASVLENGIAVDASEYEVDPDSGRLMRMSGDAEVGWIGATVTVEYTGGYDLLGELPHEVERACIDLVKRYYYARSRDPALRSEQVLDVVNSSWTAADSAPTKRGLPLEIAQRLDEFVRLS